MHKSREKWNANISYNKSKLGTSINWLRKKAHRSNETNQISSYSWLGQPLSRCPSAPLPRPVALSSRLIIEKKCCTVLKLGGVLKNDSILSITFPPLECGLKFQILFQRDRFRRWKLIICVERGLLNQPQTWNAKAKWAERLTPYSLTELIPVRIHDEND